jgi:hypothetical protein
MAISPHTRTRLIWREGKKVRAHRWIMEQHLGRKLALSEHVHHINGDPLDNRLENLVVLRQSAHIRLHNQRYPDVKKCVVCGKEYTAPNRKRQRSKCCSAECASEARAAGRKRQAASRGGSN